MNADKWDRIVTVVSKAERARLRQAAADLSLSESAIIYSLLHKETNGFRNFEGVPAIADMPRTVIVRKVQVEDA